MRNGGHGEEPGDMSRLFSGRNLFRALFAAACCTGAAGVAAAADGAALFESKCSACHSVGGGSKLGPDLKGVVARRGKAGAMLAIVDPAKAGLAPTMPKLGLTQPEAAAISAYLEVNSSGGGVAADQATPMQPAEKAEAEATPEDIHRGQALFDGSVRFANGGAPCNACHQVNYQGVSGGGILAADLTHSFARAGKPGLDAMLADAPFPVMQAAYAGKAISPEEIRALGAFLQRADKEGDSRQAGNHGWSMFFGGAGGVVVFAGLLSLLGGRRKKRCVNQDIYDRQLRSE